MIQSLSLLLLISMMGVVQASQTSKIKTYKNMYDFAQNVRLEDTVATIASLASTIPTSKINLDYSQFQKTVDDFYKIPQIVDNDKLFTQACNDPAAHQCLMTKVNSLSFNKVEETYHNLLKIRYAFVAIKPPRGCINTVTCGISLLQPYITSHGSRIDGIKKDDCHSPFRTVLKKLCCHPTSKKFS